MSVLVQLSLVHDALAELNTKLLVEQVGHADSIAVSLAVHERLLFTYDT